MRRLVKADEVVQCNLPGRRRSSGFGIRLSPSKIGFQNQFCPKGNSIDCLIDHVCIMEVTYRDSYVI